MTEKGRITHEVVEFITRVQWHDFPTEAVDLAQRCLIDGIGVMLAGATTRGSAVLHEYVRASGGAPEATAFAPDCFQTGAASAALVNAASGHAMDWDDTQLSSTPDRIFGLLTHPTMAPLAAALALGERQHVSGRSFVSAFLTGFEVECKMAEAIHPNHYMKGFHSSGTLGAFGATAAAAKLLALEAVAVANAIAITVSLCAGIRVNFGTMTKPLHVGRAAQNGIFAAELASRGFTGGREALDGPWGFFQIFGLGGEADPARISGALGNPYSILTPGVSIKPYPCGVLGHPSMDAMRKLVITHDLQPEQIAAIRLRAGSNILNPLRYKVAQSELEAKFSPPFMLAAIAIRRKAGIHEFTDEFVRSPAVQRMMTRVQTILDPEIEAQGFDKIRSIVEVDLKDGRRLVEQADERYRGGPDRPFTREELHDKFRECAELALPETAITETLSMLESLAEVPDISELVRVMSQSKRPSAVSLNPVPALPSSR